MRSPAVPASRPKSSKPTTRGFVIAPSSGTSQRAIQAHTYGLIWHGRLAGRDPLAREARCLQLSPLFYQPRDVNSNLKVNSGASEVGQRVRRIATFTRFSQLPCLFFGVSEQDGAAGTGDSPNADV